MQKETMRILSRITLISQLGLSLVTPPLLLLLGALWLQERYGTGDWILLCAILVGLLSGGCSVHSLIRAELARDRRIPEKTAEKEEGQGETGSRR